MKKQYEYFENERVLYVVSIIKGDKDEASLHMGRMQGYKDAMLNMDFDFEKMFYFHDRIMTAIDFAYRMRKRYIKNN